MSVTANVVSTCAYDHMYHVHLPPLSCTSQVTEKDKELKQLHKEIKALMVSKEACLAASKAAVRIPTLTYSTTLTSPTLTYSTTLTDYFILAIHIYFIFILQKCILILFLNYLVCVCVYDMHTSQGNCFNLNEK